MKDHALKFETKSGSDSKPFNSSVDEDSDKESTEIFRRKWSKRKWLFVLSGSFLSIIVLAVFYDFINSIYVQQSIKEWENGIIRDENGVAQGHQAFSVGAGSDAILFVHGLNDSPMCWKYMAPGLAKRNYFCSVIRLPGFAETVDNYSEKSDIDLWSKSIKSEVEILSRDHERVFVVAHSLGCSLMLKYILENEGQVSGIAILAPAIDVPAETKRMKFLGSCFYHFTTVIPADEKVPVNDKREQDIPNRMGFTPLKTVDELFKLTKFLSGRAGEISIPVFVGKGIDDQIVDSKAIDEFFQDLGTVTKEKYICENSNHKIPVDLDHKILTKKIADFFQNVK